MDTFFSYPIELNWGSPAVDRLILIRYFKRPASGVGKFGQAS